MSVAVAVTARVALAMFTAHLTHGTGRSQVRTGQVRGQAAAGSLHPHWNAPVRQQGLPDALADSLVGFAVSAPHPPQEHPEQLAALIAVPLS